MAPHEAQNTSLRCQSPQKRVQNSIPQPPKPHESLHPALDKGRVTCQSPPKRKSHTLPQSPPIKANDKSASVSSSVKAKGKGNKEKIKLLCSTELPEPAKNVLPTGYSYIVLNYVTEDRENFTGAPPDAFSCTLLIDIQNEEGVTNWLESFSEKY